MGIYSEGCVLPLDSILALAWLTACTSSLLHTLVLAIEPTLLMRFILNDFTARYCRLLNYAYADWSISEAHG